MKYAVITGASSGIGYAMAIALSKKGYKVFGCAPAFAVPAMDPLKKYGVTTFACDITNLEDIKNAVTLVTKQTNGKLDILYNNAGIAIGGPCIDYDETELNKIFQINVIGHINVTKHFADLIIAGKGTIVFTSSIAGFMPLSWSGAYSATKAAINAYAQTLNMEMKPFGVKVYSVITGGVDTAIADSAASAPTEFSSKFNDLDGVKESAEITSKMTKNMSESPEVYAEGIANKITRKKNYGFNLYKGYHAVTSYYVYRWLPLWLIQYSIAKKFLQLRVFAAIRRKMKVERPDP